ncbi:MAG TPA: hypothetical protein VMW63_10135 [Methanoregulaceae archaeon]|nr:hypothetical protein [Methanoregulaceae archaeon]
MDKTAQGPFPKSYRLEGKQLNAWLKYHIEEVFPNSADMGIPIVKYGE